jgi:hypothetical protein
MLFLAFPLPTMNCVTCHSSWCCLTGVEPMSMESLRGEPPGAVEVVLGHVHSSAACGGGGGGATGRPDDDDEGVLGLRSSRPDTMVVVGGMRWVGGCGSVDADGGWPGDFTCQSEASRVESIGRSLATKDLCVCVCVCVCRA